MNLRKKLWKKAGFIIRPIAMYYYKKPRPWQYKSLDLVVNPGVFPLHLTESTAIMVDFLEDKDLTNKDIIDLGCGSGALSIFCAQKGGNVLAIDIAEEAIKNTKENAQRNNVTLRLSCSNLLNDVDANSEWDWLVANPPYYPKQPQDDAEKAWYCGTEFEYFKTFFKQFNAIKDCVKNSAIVLSEECDIKRIQLIAAENMLCLVEKYVHESSKDKHIIFELLALE